MPMLPPGAGSLLRLRKPCIEFALNHAAGPELILVPVGMIDDAGDMSRAGDNEIDRPAEELAAEENRSGRRNMVITRCEHADLYHMYFSWACSASVAASSMPPTH